MKTLTLSLAASIILYSGLVTADIGPITHIRDTALVQAKEQAIMACKSEAYSLTVEQKYKCVTGVHKAAREFSGKSLSQIKLEIDSVLEVLLVDKSDPVPKPSMLGDLFTRHSAMSIGGGIAASIAAVGAIIAGLTTAGVPLGMAFIIGALLGVPVAYISTDMFYDRIPH